MFHVLVQYTCAGSGREVVFAIKSGEDLLQVDTRKMHKAAWLCARRPDRPKVSIVRRVQ